MQPKTYLLKPGGHLAKPISLPSSLVAAGRHSMLQNSVLSNELEISDTSRNTEEKQAKLLGSSTDIGNNPPGGFRTKHETSETQEASELAPIFSHRHENKSENRLGQKRLLMKPWLPVGAGLEPASLATSRAAQSYFNLSLSPHSHSARGAVFPMISFPPAAARKTVILDLDETLVHASAAITNPDHIFTRLLPDNTSHYIKLSIRPYAKEFLRSLSPIADVVIFTASVKLYADPIIDLLDPAHSLIKARYYRDSCIASPNGFIKDLSIVKKSLKDLLIIDNQPVSFSYHKENGYLIPGWFGDRSDTELCRLSKTIRRVLAQEDIRKCDKTLLLK